MTKGIIKNITINNNGSKCLKFNGSNGHLRVICDLKGKVTLSLTDQFETTIIESSIGDIEKLSEQLLILMKIHNENPTNRFYK